MNRLLTLISALTLLGAADAVIAHGEADESVAEFHEHLDDYSAEVNAFIAEVDAIVLAYAADENVDPEIDALVDRWEQVAVHDAIETHAAVTYPAIWQNLVSLQQAALEGKPGSEVADAGDALEAALWQAFGALRLAAANVESGESHGHADEHGGDAGGSDTAASGPESIDRIVAELEQAVEAYAGGDGDAAEDLIHHAYMDRFEYLEGDLIARDAELVTRLEKDFNATLPLLIQDGAPASRVRSALESVKSDLMRARRLLAEAEDSRSDVF